MGSQSGAVKAAAKAVGLTESEYIARRSSGLKRCTKCKTWKLVSSAFRPDKSRTDGISATCRVCRSLKGYPDHMSTSDRIKHGWVTRKLTFVPPMKGKKMSDTSRLKMSLAAKSRPSNRIGKKHTVASKKKISDSVRQVVARGPAHYAYTHGRHQRDKDARRSPEYKAWRDAVYRRDRYTCQSCGDARGGNLQAHHIKSFAAHPELRFDVANGVTMCQDCHERVHLKPIPMPRDLARRKKRT